MKHINSIIMALVTSMIVWMPSNVALALPTDGDGGTTGSIGAKPSERLRERKYGR